MVQHYRQALGLRELPQRRDKGDVLGTGSRGVIGWRGAAYQLQPPPRPPPVADREAHRDGADPGFGRLGGKDVTPPVPGTYEGFLNNVLGLTEVTGEGVHLADDPWERRRVERVELVLRHTAPGPKTFPIRMQPAESWRAYRSCTAKNITQGVLLTRESKVIRKAAAAAVLGALMLASTACEPSGADVSGASQTSVQPSATNSPKTGETASAEPGEASAKPGGGSAKPSAGSGNTAPTAGAASATAPAAIAACAVSDLAFSATNEDENGKPVRHLLLTVTNTGSKKCSLYAYPYLKFPYARAPIAVIEDSKDAPATLAPGEKAYAALLASGGHMDTYDTNTLPLSLQGPHPGSKPSEPVNVGLPGQVPFDDGARVTYWITASGLALRFIMSS